MKCFVCNDPGIEMVKIADDDVVCPICHTRFDLDHANRIENELKKNGYISMSNESLADQWSKYFFKKFPELKFIKWGISQWIYINEQGKKSVFIQLLERKEKIRNQLNEINAILGKIY